MLTGLWPVGFRLVEARSYDSERGYATIPAKHGELDAKKPNPGSRSTFTDHSKKEVIFKFGFWRPFNLLPHDMVQRSRAIQPRNNVPLSFEPPVPCK